MNLHQTRIKKELEFLIPFPKAYLLPPTVPYPQRQQRRLNQLRIYCSFYSTLYVMQAETSILISLGLEKEEKSAHDAFIWRHSGWNEMR